MLENILKTKCMDMESIVLQTGIDTKDHGMKEEGKGLVRTLSETAKRNLAIGTMGSLISQVLIVQHIQYHQLLSIIPEFFMQSR